MTHTHTIIKKEKLAPPHQNTEAAHFSSFCFCFLFFPASFARREEHVCVWSSLPCFCWGRSLRLAAPPPSPGRFFFFKEVFWIPKKKFLPIQNWCTTCCSRAGRSHQVHHKTSTVPMRTHCSRWRHLALFFFLYCWWNFFCAQRFGYKKKKSKLNLLWKKLNMIGGVKLSSINGWPQHLLFC